MFNCKIIVLSWISMSLVFCEFTGEPKTEIIEIATKAGYPVEKHEIVTEDGYILNMFRIPHRCSNIESCETAKNEPLLVMHGLGGTAETYVVPDNKSLGLYLNDRGYDVWLGNSRGTWQSRKHKTLNPDTDKEFWKFTWHEMGKYDLPAMIDHILTVTKKEKISYIGHSQGSTIFYVLCSERPEYNDKLKIHISLAPGTFLGNTKNPFFKLFPPFFHIVKDLPDYLNVFEVEAIFRNRQLYSLAKTFCVSYNEILLNICKLAVDTFVDSFGNNIDKYILPQLIDIAPGGASIYQLIHYLQNIVLGNFAQYNWSEEINVKKYNSKYPTPYNLSKITTPVVIYHGPNDCIIVPKDVKILASMIPNLVELYEIPNKKWSHLDFVYGNGIVSLVYERMMRTLDQYAETN